MRPPGEESGRHVGKVEERMSAKAGFPFALILGIAGWNSLWGGEPQVIADETAAPPAFIGGTEVSNTAPTVMPSPYQTPYMGNGNIPAPVPGVSYAGTGNISPAGSGLSDWLKYIKPDCCGPVGGCGPIMTELYVRNGPSIPVGGGVLGAALNTGFMFQGGGRSLFFNSELSAAWAVDIGISYNFNQGVGNRTINMNFSVPTDVPGVFEDLSGPLQLRQLSRTSFNWAVGREYYLFVWPGSGAALRMGAHVGGQLGAIKADWEVIPHTTDMLWALTLASNMDLEIPWGCITLVGGLRVEWNYLFETDIVQHQNDNDLQSVNILIVNGFRY
jgi:hypothetical protein